MARTKSTEKLVPVTGAITPELREVVEAYRWDHRQTTSDVVREALEVWAKDKGLVVESPKPEDPATETDAPEAVKPTPATAKVR